MSSSIKQNLASDQIVRINDFDLIGMVQNFSWTPNLGNDPDYELGNRGKVGDSYEGDVSASLTLKSVGGLSGMLARLIEKRDVSDAFLGYQYASGGASGKNGYTFTQDDLANTRADLLVHERPDGTSFSRSTWLPRMQLATLSGSYGANAASTETMAFTGSDDVGLPSPFHDVRAIAATVTDSTHLQLVDATVASTTWTLIYVMVNDERFRNSTKSGTDSTTCALGSAGVVTLTSTSGFAIPADADCQVLVCKTIPGTTFPSILTSARTTTATSVRGNKSTIFISPADAANPTDAERWLCAQSLDYTVNLGLTNLDQIAFTDRSTSTYARVVTFPMDVSITTSVYETDWKEWQVALLGSFTGSDPYDNLFEFSPVAIKTNFAIVVDSFTKAGTKLQRLTFSDMSPSGRGKQVGVRGRSEIQWTFAGTLMKVQGFNA